MLGSIEQAYRLGRAVGADVLVAGVEDGNIGAAEEDGACREPAATRFCRLETSRSERERRLKGRSRSNRSERERRLKGRSRSNRLVKLVVTFAGRPKKANT